MSRPHPPYQDNPRGDPFADGSTTTRGSSYDQNYSDRNDYNYDPYDSHSGNGVSVFSSTTFLGWGFRRSLAQSNRRRTNPYISTLDRLQALLPFNFSKLT